MLALMLVLSTGAAAFVAPGAVVAEAAPAQSRQAPYNTARAEQAFAAGQAQYKAGDLTAAAKHFETALEFWPVHQGAWQWLTEAYRHLERSEDYRHAIFFRERTAWALDVDLRHAKRIFDDVAAGRKRAGDLDERYAETAKQLSVFYDYVICRTQAARETELAKRLTFDQKYGLEKAFGLTPKPGGRPCGR
ncbi:MAG: hypothetical protein RIB59_01090 [Rhodospirillales bacterium]